MKYKSRPLEKNKFPTGKAQLCKRCGITLSKEDLKLGCARCEWRDAGIDAPKGWKVKN